MPRNDAFILSDCDDLAAPSVNTANQTVSIITIFSNWLFSILGSHLLAFVCGMGIYGMWISPAADEFVRGILMLLRWKSGIWRWERIIQIQTFASIQEDTI